jgi:hypothetical protein
VLTRHIRFTSGLLWTFANAVGLSNEIVRIQAVSSGSLIRFASLALLLVLWALASALVLGVLVHFDLRDAMRDQATRCDSTTILQIRENNHV